MQSWLYLICSTNDHICMRALLQVCQNHWRHVSLCGIDASWSSGCKKNRRPKRTRTNKKTPFAGETVNKNEANFSSQQTCHHFTSFATVFPNIWAHQGCCKKVDMAKEPWKNHDGNGKQKHQSIRTLGLVEAFWLWRWRFRWDKCGVPFHLLSTKWVYRSTRKRY